MVFKIYYFFYFKILYSFNDDSLVYNSPFYYKVYQLNEKPFHAI